MKLDGMTLEVKQPFVFEFSIEVFPTLFITFQLKQNFSKVELQSIKLLEFSIFQELLNLSWTF